MLGAIVFTAGLLVAGVMLRSRFRIFAAARIPASLLAGTIGLIAWQGFQWSVSGDGNEWVVAFEHGAMANLRTWPGWLIAVVFAGMLLSKSPRLLKLGEHARDVGGGFSPVAREALMVWIIVLGQTVVGLWMVWWWIGPTFQLPASAAMLIETGFAGGHGTAAAMGTVFAHPVIAMDEGLDLGVLMATTGLVYGLVSGILWIEVGVRCGWVAGGSAAQHAPLVLDSPQSNTMTPTNVPRESTLPPPDAIDPLLLQLMWLMLAFAIGVGLQTLVDQMAASLDATGWFAAGGDSDTSGDDVLRDRLRIAGVVGSFPLFIYTLFGGAIVRFVVTNTIGAHWIDHERIQRLIGTSMDLLVVAAVVTLNLAVVASLWVPMVGLFLGGAIWSTFCLLVLSRKILPASHWFELGLINFGMSTGTTATGFVLLRVIDPDLKTRAAEQYALAAPLSAPFVGGGMLTVGLPLLLLERVPIGVSAVGLTVILLVLVGWGMTWKRKL
jgi:ESS family glutamate:Na+ symporter